MHHAIQLFIYLVNPMTHFWSQVLVLCLLVYGIFPGIRRVSSPTIISNHCSVIITSKRLTYHHTIYPGSVWWNLDTINTEFDSCSKNNKNNKTREVWITIEVGVKLKMSLWFLPYQWHPSGPCPPITEHHSGINVWLWALNPMDSVLSQR